MSNEGDRAAVFKTTKVRTKLKGDSSWLQRRSEPQDERKEEKPWLAEVRASRLNGASLETSPVSSPTKPTASPIVSDTEKAPTSGYLIRGVFTKTEKPASSSTSNGISGTTQFTKKPSESYKRIAPHTVRSASETQEGTLSPEEQEKRTEAASNVLRKSAGRQRSYVLSAAKFYESKDKTADTSLVNNSTSFVAKRVEITDDDESVAAPAPVSPPPPSTDTPDTHTAAVPEPKPRKIVDASAKVSPEVTDNEPVAPKVEEAALEAMKEEDPAPVSVTEKDPFEGMTPGCTKVATPLPELIPELVQAVCTKPDDSKAAESPVAEAAPPSPTPTPPPAASAVPESPAPLTPAIVSPASVSVVTVKTEPEPELKVEAEPEPEPKVEAEPGHEPEPEPKVEAEPAPEPEVEAEPEPVTKVEAEPEPEPKVEAEPEPVTKVEAEPEPEPKVEAEPAPEPKVEAEPAPEPKVEAEPEPVTKVEAEPEPEPKVEAEPAPEPKVEAEPEPESKVEAEPAPEPKVEAEPEPEVEAEPEPVTKIEAEPEPVTKIEAELEPVTKVQAEPEPEPKVQAEPEPVTKVEAEPEPEPKVEAEPAPEPKVEAEPEPESKVEAEPEPEPKVEAEPEPEPSSNLSSNVDTLSALSDTLISFGTSPSSLMEDEPVLEKEEGGSVNIDTGNGVEQEPTPKLSNCEPITDDLLFLNNGPEQSAEPVPPSPGRWSQDLLSGLDSGTDPAKTSGTVGLLVNDIDTDDVIITTQTRSLSMEREEEKQTDETAKETQSLTETATITTKTVIITDKSEEENAAPQSSRVITTVTESSSADPFDPYPIGTTSPNSSSDLLQPLSDIPINSASLISIKNEDPSPEINMSSKTLESLADDIIPIDTDTRSLSSHRSWARTWEVNPPQQTNTDESREAEPEGQAEDQQTVVMFERKSKENDSPWDRWTSPTVYTINTEEEEEEKEEERPEDTQTETVTTITTVREIHSEPEPAMDRYETYSRTVTEENQQVQTPEPKKGFVYLKEYVSATELSLHNTKDYPSSGSDYLTSSSANYSYSSPSKFSSGSLSSKCTYCGEPVGSDAKITIEHLNINCHPSCFKCGVCGRPMGDLLYNMFLHGGKVHCESCYSKAFD
ncbi:zinc finger protein 185 isoform X2 [Sphaeramia orbicularis]|uniref:zinc finger protein 185 isoform X2 n=1 Tax=Sphaeramia orbicularis TaxID=375764 RepID=UPI00117E9052|nr:zinc finger protein 185 isoform X2 [Sphaeramia orbicularis]